MVDYDLTIQSTPTGIEMKVEALDTSEWIVTNKTRTYPDGTVITVIAPPSVGEALGTPDMGWRFLKWEDDSIELSREVTLSTDTTIIATYEYVEYYPVRHPTRRQEKFTGKVDEEVYGLRTTALKSMMVEQVAVTTAQQDTMERLIGKYLNELGLYGIQLHHYRNFSQELYGLIRLFTSETLNKEATLKAVKWKARLVGDGEVEATVKTRLEAIAKYFNITITWP